MLIGYGLKIAISKYGFTPIELPKHAKHEVGKTYWCGYWQTWYKVLDIIDNHIVCKWEDGHINSHMTSLDRHDYELIWN